MGQYVIGIDVGGTTVKTGIFRTDGQLLKKWEIPTDKTDCGSHVLTDIAASVLDQLTQEQISLDQVEGAGIGVPGAVQNFCTVHGCVNIGWGETDTAVQLSGLLSGLPVLTANDADAATLGELWLGGARGYETAVMVTLGTGVGGGIVVNGKILEGAHGAAGEIGHICVEPDETDACGCGKCGHLEQYASATGIVRVARKILERNTEESSLRAMQEMMTAKVIFDAAKEGDVLALQAVDTAASYLGRALAAISCVVDPQIILLGGGVSKAGSILTDAVSVHYRKHAFFPSESTPIRLAQLGNDAGICGAAKLMLP